MRRKIAISLISLIIFHLCSYQVRAQYPSMAGVQDELDAKKKKWDSLDAVAWEKAFPVVIDEMNNKNKYYCPWAQRDNDLQQANIPAFPGAEGGGMYTCGGRGGKVFVVTTLADGGEGSLRAACEAGGARIVVFNVAGIIKLERPLNINAPYITIAGQTAPGDGVCIAGETVCINTHDVIIRHMRFRRGETWVGRRDDALGGNPVGNIIIDHVSASWGLDENMTLYRHMFTNAPDVKKATRHKLLTVNLTIQNSIFSEALDTYNHAFGSTISGDNCMFVRNLWANNRGRNPSVGMGGDFNFINNVVYNWHHRTMDGGDYSTRYNLINNYYKPGPVTPTDKPVGHRFVKADSRFTLDGYKFFGRVWVSGNIMEGYPEITEDNWKGGVQINDNSDDLGEYLENVKWHEPFETPYVNIMEANEAYKFVLDNVGANLPKRDPVDARVIKQVRTNVVDLDNYVKIDDLYQFEHRRLGRDSYKYGIITDIRQVGGYPEYTGKPYKDTDMDGMPDAWEKIYGLNPKDASDANGDINGDGYNNIEKYINGIDPTKKVDWTDLKNNKNTLEASDLIK